MQALVLAGGEGTRLRPLTARTPKAIMPLVGRPFMRFVIDWLARNGIDDVVLACGFGAATVRETLGTGNAGVRLRYVEEPEPLGTAGAIKHAESLLEERFLALNGDVLADFDLARLMDEHERIGARATIALHEVEDPSSYGLVQRVEDGPEILEFAEKPPLGAGPGEINAGVYVLERSLLASIPPGEASSIERDLFPSLVGRGLCGCTLEGYWSDIGTPERYLEASWDVLEGRVETSFGVAAGDALLDVAADAYLADGASVAPPAVLGPGVRIGPGARVGGRAVVGGGCEIGERAVVERAVLGESCRVGADGVVRDAILAAGAEIGDGAIVGEVSVVGAGARVAPRSELSGVAVE